jgi:hypothetical protein
VVGCPANTNLRQNSSSKAKGKAHYKLKLARSGSFIHIHHFQSKARQQRATAAPHVTEGTLDHTSAQDNNCH